MKTIENENVNKGELIMTIEGIKTNYQKAYFFLENAIKHYQKYCATEPAFASWDPNPVVIESLKSLYLRKAALVEPLPAHVKPSAINFKERKALKETLMSMTKCFAGNMATVWYLDPHDRKLYILADECRMYNGQIARLGVPDDIILQLSEIAVDYNKRTVQTDIYGNAMDVYNAYKEYFLGQQSGIMAWLIDDPSSFKTINDEADDMEIEIVYINRKRVPLGRAIEKLPNPLRASSLSLSMSKFYGSYENVVLASAHLYKYNEMVNVVLVDPNYVEWEEIRDKLEWIVERLQTETGEPRYVDTRRDILSIADIETALKADTKKEESSD